MRSRKTLGIAVTIVILGAAFALWGLRGVAVYLGIKFLALALLALLWIVRRRVAAEDRSRLS